MKKIPTIFLRGEDGKITREINPVCQWVFDGEGVPTVKFDGTCCLVRDGKLYKRREVRKGGEIPPDFELVDYDENTGKSFGWVPVGDGSEDKYHREAFVVSDIPDGTYELMGPKVQKNSMGLSTHWLVPHGKEALYDIDRNYDAIKLELQHAMPHVEGIVYWHPDGRKAKIKKRDFE